MRQLLCFLALASGMLYGQHINHGSIVPYNPHIEQILLRSIPCDTSHNCIRHIEQKVGDFFKNSGYPFAQFTLTLSHDSLTIAAESKERFYFGALHNVDTSKSSDSIVSRYALVPHFTPFSESTLLLIKKRLERSPYFTLTPSFELARHPSRSILYPVFSIRDNTVNSIEGVASWSNDTSPYGMVRLELYNLQGTLRDLTFNYQSDESHTAISFFYKEPWLFSSAFNGTLSADLIEINDTSQKTTVEGGIQTDYTFETSVGLFAGITHISNRSDSSTHTQRTGKINVTYDTRDHRLFAKNGHRVYSEVTLFSRRGSGNYAYAWLLDMGYFKTLSGAFILNPGLSLGTIYSKEPLLSLESYLLGGAESVRGFRENTFIAQSYALLPLEIRYLYSPTGALTLFCDQLLYNSNISSHWNYSIGYGMGILQSKNNWSIGLELASHPRLSLFETLIHVRIKHHF